MSRNEAVKAYLTPQEKEEVIYKYFTLHQMQKEISKEYNVRTHVIATCCSDWYDKQRENYNQTAIVEKAKPFSMLEKIAEQKLIEDAVKAYDSIHTISDCKTNPELLNKTTYHTITVMSSI